VANQIALVENAVA